MASLTLPIERARAAVAVIAEDQTREEAHVARTALQGLLLYAATPTHEHLCDAISGVTELGDSVRGMRRVVPGEVPHRVSARAWDAVGTVQDLLKSIAAPNPGHFEAVKQCFPWWDWDVPKVPKRPRPHPGALVRSDYSGSNLGLVVAHAATIVKNSNPCEVLFVNWRGGSGLDQVDEDLLTVVQSHGRWFNQSGDSMYQDATGRWLLSWSGQESPGGDFQSNLEAAHWFTNAGVDLRIVGLG